jgi:hypothetical protein
MNMKEDKMGWSYNTHGWMRNVYRVSARNLKERDNLEDLGIHYRILFAYILEKSGGKMWT